MLFCKPDELHVYVLYLSESTGSEKYQIARSLLSKRENKYLYRIKAPQRCIEYVFGRFILKKILSQYLEIPANNIFIKTDKNGKPRLSGEYSIPKLSFNISHSANIFLLSICQQGEIGIDVEKTNNQILPNIDSIARYYFSFEEQSLLTESHPQIRLEHFFRIWTLKEAVLKAIGTGLSVPLAQINVAAPRDYYHTCYRKGDEIMSLKACHWDNLIPGYHIAIARVGELGVLKVFGLGFPRENFKKLKIRKIGCYQQSKYGNFNHTPLKINKDLIY